MDNKRVVIESTFSSYCMSLQYNNSTMILFIPGHTPVLGGSESVKKMIFGKLHRRRTDKISKNRQITKQPFSYTVMPMAYGPTINTWNMAIIVNKWTNDNWYWYIIALLIAQLFKGAYFNFPPHLHLHLHLHLHTYTHTCVFRCGFFKICQILNFLKQFLASACKISYFCTRHSRKYFNKITMCIYWSAPLV